MPKEMKLRRGRTQASRINDALAPGADFTVANLPAASLYPGRLVYVTNGAAGAACAAVSNGTNWMRITIGAAVAGA